MKEWLSGKKTYILSGLAVLTALIPVLTGEVNFMAFIQSPEISTLIYALIPASLRSAIAKAE